jgi:hypothetical protein
MQRCWQKGGRERKRRERKERKRREGNERKRRKRNGKKGRKRDGRKRSADTPVRQLVSPSIFCCPLFPFPEVLPGSEMLYMFYL